MPSETFWVLGVLVSKNTKVFILQRKIIFLVLGRSGEELLGRLERAESLSQSQAAQDTIDESGEKSREAQAPSSL